MERQSEDSGGPTLMEFVPARRYVANYSPRSFPITIAAAIAIL